VDVQTPEIATDKSQQRRAARRHHLAWLGIAHGQLIELQTLAPAKDGVGHVAFTTSVEKALDLAESTSIPDRYNPERLRPFEYQGVYAVFNAHVEGMQYMIANDAWAPTPKGLTTDERIAYRRAFYLDLDTHRPNALPISATDVEVKATILRAKVVRADIKGELAAIGIENPADVIGVMMSGNGVQDWFRLDNIPSTPELTKTIKHLLMVWSALFDTPDVHVDTSVFDPKRIGPLGAAPQARHVQGLERAASPDACRTARPSRTLQNPAHPGTDDPRRGEAGRSRGGCAATAAAAEPHRRPARYGPRAR